MKGPIVIIGLLALGLAGGVGAGMMLAPEPEPAIAECDPLANDACGEPEPSANPGVSEADVGDEDPLFDYVKLANQFVIPIIREERVSALVVVSVTLEVTAGASAEVFDREPRIRDAFLQEMFDYAYLGGFDGPFTRSENLTTLRRALRESAQRISGPVVRDVLIVDLVRQEV